MQDTIPLIGSFKIFVRKAVGKRSSTKVPQLLFTPLVWAFLKAESISSFAQSLSPDYKGGKDVLYRFLRRESINCRSISGSISKKVFDQQNLRHEPNSAFVIDDILKHRKEKSRSRFPSVWSHLNPSFIFRHAQSDNSEKWQAQTCSDEKWQAQTCSDEWHMVN